MIDRSMTFAGAGDPSWQSWFTRSGKKPSMAWCCILAASRGQEATVAAHTSPPNARLIQTFEAGSHYEAMTLYHTLLGREQYTTDQSWHYEPYPEQWRQEQQP